MYLGTNVKFQHPFRFEKKTAPFPTILRCKYQQRITRSHRTDYTDPVTSQASRISSSAVLPSQGIQHKRHWLEHAREKYKKLLEPFQQSLLIWYVRLDLLDEGQFWDDR